MRHIEFRPTMIGALVLALSLALSACGSGSPSSGSIAASSTHHCGITKKVKIGAHLGIAYIAFKKWVYNPWKRGDFASGTPHRKLHIVEGAVAALVGVHEAKVAVREFRTCGAGSRSAALLDSIQGKLTSLKNGSSATTPNSMLASQVQSLNGSYQQLRSVGTR